MMRYVEHVVEDIRLLQTVELRCRVQDGARCGGMLLSLDMGSGLTGMRGSNGKPPRPATEEYPASAQSI